MWRDIAQVAVFVVVLVPFWSIFVLIWLKSATLAELAHRYRNHPMLFVFGGFMANDASDYRVFLCIMSGLMMLAPVAIFVAAIVAA